ncbi:MAG: hypothetical protein KDJ99_30670, partial [Candidatus Competibacteraceae bacterium]|nr:hypothetical protein [Candidatus Competibacteraceae bacterium]
TAVQIRNRHEARIRHGFFIDVLSPATGGARKQSPVGGLLSIARPGDSYARDKLAGVTGANSIGTERATGGYELPGS